MNLKLIFISLGLLLTELLTAQDQTTELSLKQVIEIARMESPDAQTARHSFRSAYWNYKYYRANYLPSLSLTSDPNLKRAINKITMGDGCQAVAQIISGAVTQSPHMPFTIPLVMSSHQHYAGCQSTPQHLQCLHAIAYYIILIRRCKYACPRENDSTVRPCP